MRSSSGRSSSACPLNLSFAAALSAGAGAVPPPPETSSSPTTPASPPSPFSSNPTTKPTKAAGTSTSCPWTAGQGSPPPTSSVASLGFSPVEPSLLWKPPATVSSSSPQIKIKSFSDVLLCLQPGHSPVCSPSPLPLLRGFCIAGMYPHPHTGEYRLLTYLDPLLEQDEPWPAAGYHCYVYALGSSEPPRDIGWPVAEEAIHALDPVLLRGGLHWFIDKDKSESCMIMVFDTIAELFRQMHAPAVPGPGETDLLEMDGMLGMASFTDARTTIDIWMAQDYDNEIWAFKYRVKLPVVELATRFGLDKYNSRLVVSSCDDDDNDLLILVNSGGWLLQIDMAGKLVSSFHRKLVGPTLLRFKQSLVRHTFFPTREGYVVNDWPLISPDDHVVDT
uniref:Uncharacterized protein n=1 Tax=Avena sativa TaxID=4498 RepID=A0ACD5WKP1_AVESA